jgi:hypothetical protein
MDREFLSEALHSHDEPLTLRLSSNEASISGIAYGGASQAFNILECRDNCFASAAFPHGRLPRQQGSWTRPEARDPSRASGLFNSAANELERQDPSFTRNIERLRD